MSKPSNQEISVAIVEDVGSLRAIYADWIDKAEGFRLVGEHGDGLEAAEMLLTEQPDVVLMDINLPKMSGVDCTFRLKKLVPQVQMSA